MIITFFIIISSSDNIKNILPKCHYLSEYALHFLLLGDPYKAGIVCEIKFELIPSFNGLQFNKGKTGMDSVLTSS